MTCHTTIYLKKLVLFRVMLFIYRRQSVPRQIASVCDLRMQREKRYFILMPGLLRYFRLWSCSSSWSTKFDFLVAFDILVILVTCPHFSRFTTNLPPLYNYANTMLKKRKEIQYQAAFKGNIVHFN